MMSFRGVSSKNIDTVQSYVGGVLISTGYADRGGERSSNVDIASRDGVFYSSVSDFYDTTVASWRQENSVQTPRHALLLVSS